MKKYFKKIIFCTLFLSGFFVWQNAEAACTWDENTCNVSTCSYSSIGTEIDEIQTNSPGKTGEVIIQCPEESITNTQDITINMTSGFSGITNLHIRGYGTTPSGTDSAGRGAADLTSLTDRSIRVILTSGKTFTVSNIKFSGTPNSSYPYGAGLAIYGQGNYNFHHNTFWYYSGRLYYVSDASYGVIHSNYEIFRYQRASFEDKGTYGNASWITGVTLGSANAHYNENNESMYIPETGTLALPTIVGGAITAINFSVSNGYEDATGTPNVYILGGSGTGATAHVTSMTHVDTNNNTIDGIAIDAGGSGYSGSRPPVVVFSSVSRDVAANKTSETAMMFADGAQGSRIVNRYNTIVNMYIGAHDASSNYRGHLQYENYNNYSIMTNNYTAAAYGMRGGTGVVYNNKIWKVSSNGLFYLTNKPIQVRNYRDAGCSSATGWPDIKPMCSADSTKACFGTTVESGTWKTCLTEEDCGGTTGSTNFCLQVDGNGEAGYPCRDAIGFGNNAMDSKPFLFWNNQLKLGSGSYSFTEVGISCGSPTTILKDRDYCESASTIPVLCNGVTTNYTEYTCPHPSAGLTGSCDSDVAGTAGYNLGGGDIIPPAAPSGLSVS